MQSVAVIDDRTAYGQGVAGVFGATAQTLGLKLVGSHCASDRTVAFMPILTAIRAQRPDADFYGGMDAQSGRLLRQMAQLGMSDVKLLGGDGVCTSRLLELAGGAWHVTPMVCAEGGAALARMGQGGRWKQRYNKRFPGQCQLYSPCTDDAVMVLVDARQRAGSAEPQHHAAKLFDTRYEGVTADTRLNAQGGLVEPSVTLSSFEGGSKAMVK